MLAPTNDKAPASSKDAEPNMRKLLLLLLLALIVLQPAAAQAKTLRMAYDADPTSLDPHEQLASSTLQLSHLIFDPLVRFRQD